MIAQLIGILLFIIFSPVIILYKILKAISKSNQKKTQNAKLAEKIPHIRTALRKDRRKLLEVMIDVIKQHWDTLDDKFEQYVDEDDYGNIFMRPEFQKELTYFSQKVILPELQLRVDNGETSNKDVSLILQDTLELIQKAETVDFGIKFDDSSQDITEKLVSHITSSLTTDDVLYEIHTNPEAMAAYVGPAADIFMHNQAITLNFQEKLKTSQPIHVSAFAAVVFVVYSALHNSKKGRRVSKNQHGLADFIGNDPYKYEEYIKSLLRSDGFDAKRTRGSGDFGVDVIARKNGKTFAIQCKLYNHPVGSKAIQEIVSGRMYYRTNFAVVVSDNSFTDAAKMLARRSNVLLVHHKNLLYKMNILAPGEDDDDDDDDALTDGSPAVAGGGVATPPAAAVSPPPQPSKQSDQWTQADADELISVILPTIFKK